MINKAYKLTVFVAIVVFIVITFCFGQDIINNPKKPQSKYSGETIKLEEIMRIKDDGEIINFRAPYSLQVDENGNIYCADNFSIYKFDEEGNIVFKILKRGQGPGEIQSKPNYLVTKKGIIVLVRRPPKILLFDLNGEYKNETKIQNISDFQFVGLIQDKIFAFQEEIPYLENEKARFVDFPRNLIEISLDFKKQMNKYSFPMKYYVMQGSWWARSKLDFVLKDIHTLFLVYTPNYQIIHFNIEKILIEKVISRKYKRVKFPTSKEKILSGALSPPDYEFYLDINKLLLYKNYLLAITSTKKNENYLVDIYNMKGTYINNFFLDFPDKFTPHNFRYHTILLNSDDFIYSIDVDKDGFFSIAKYSFLPEDNIFHHK